MEKTLDDIEVRVLGCLIEKELSTPEYYPLTLKALVNACNQKSNRSPVMALEDADVVSALDTLRNMQLALLSAEGGRALKYRHTLMERLRLDPAELALLSELLLRGPQTSGELRARSERMHQFSEMADVEEALQELMDRSPPLVVRLPRMTGHKEQRYAHMLAGQPEPCINVHLPESNETEKAIIRTAGDRITTLEREIELIRSEVAELRKALEEFRTQFE
jgi:uncharacterized protein